MATQDDKDKRAQEEEPAPKFTVTDRRGKEKDAPAQAPGETAPTPGAAGEAGESGGGQEPAAESDPGAGTPPPPITFATFIFSLSSSALVQLGEIPDPFTKKTEKNLMAAQQTIDLLGLLEQKTAGNRTEEENKALEAVLYDLRMRFLKASGRL